MSETEEYEVDFIVEAKAVKVSKKVAKSHKSNGVALEFRVRWKGYGENDDTWEPLDSFIGSEGVVERFWERSGDKRDYHDFSKFSVGETFVPMGPPRKKAKRKSTHKEDTPPPAETPSTRGGNGAHKQSSSSKRPRAVADTAQDARPPKRPKDDLVAALNAQSKSFQDEMSTAPGSSAAPSKSKVPITPRKGKATKAPSPELIPDSDEEAEIVMHLGEDSRSSNSNSISRVQSPSIPIQRTEVKPTDTQKTPAHRLRVSKPLIKPYEDANIAVPQGQLSAKTRALERNAHKNTPTASSSRATRSVPARASVRQPKPTASLLTGTKSGLKTLKGNYAPKNGGNDRTHNDDLLVADSEFVEPPKPQELLALAMEDVRDGSPLPDFTEEVSNGQATKDVPAPSGDVETDVAAVERAESLNKARESLFPASSLSNVAVSAPEWKQSTIFGPLGLGSDITNVVTTELDPESPDASQFSLNLDSSTSIPVLLWDTIPAGSKLVSGIHVSYKSPPGKFYSRDAAMAILDAIRTGTGCAKVNVHKDVSEDEKKHFIHFVNRLETGDLFIGTFGTQIYAFCSSTNSLLCQRLNIAPNLQVTPHQVLVANIAVENYSGYADAAARADPRLWSQYVISLS